MYCIETFYNYRRKHDEADNIPIIAYKKLVNSNSKVWTIKSIASQNRLHLPSAILLVLDKNHHARKTRLFDIYTFF